MATKIKFYPSDTTVNIQVVNESKALDKLPAGVYGIDKNMFGFYLTIKGEKLDLPSKIYGVTEARADKIIRTFTERLVSTGVLLTGTKGSGKTMLSSLTANKLIEKGLPVILINEPWYGEDFIDFVNQIGECVIIFDEFAKTYARAEGDAQASLLNMMDGQGARKRLIILTENSEASINDFMINRPGRIYYHFRYDKLEEASIIGYCDDNGINEETSKKIVDMSRVMRTFTFDIFKAIVEEYKRIGGDLDELVEDMNITYDRNAKVRLKITKLIRKEDEQLMKVEGLNAYIDKPTARSGHTYIRAEDPTYDKKYEGYDEGDEMFSTNIHPNYVKYDAEGTIVYDSGNYIVTCVEQEPLYTNYSHYAM